VHGARQLRRCVREPAATVVEQQDVLVVLHREREVEIAVAVRVTGRGIHALTRDAGRQMRRRDFRVQRLRRCTDDREATQREPSELHRQVTSMAKK
jgi:hypothetical protein